MSTFVDLLRECGVEPDLIEPTLGALDYMLDDPSSVWIIALCRDMVRIQRGPELGLDQLPSQDEAIWLTAESSEKAAAIADAIDQLLLQALLPQRVHRFQA